MKHEIGIEKPDYLIEDWPGKYDAFSWLEYVVTVPNPIVLITTLKENGIPNANLHSWSLMLGHGDRYVSLLAVMGHMHTAANILRTGEWCINVPDYGHYPEAFETIYNNEAETDEITNAGFTIEEAKTIEAPRITECLANLECRLDWHRRLYEGSSWTLFCGTVQHVAIDEKAISSDPEQRMRNMQLMYNIRSTVNPLNGEQYGPNTLGLIREVVKITSDDGMVKLWREQERDTR